MALASKSTLKIPTTIGSALTADGIKNTAIGLGGLSFGTMISSAGGVAVGAPVAVASGALAVAGAVESAYGATVLLSSARNMGSDMQKLGDAMSSPEDAGSKISIDDAQFGKKIGKHAQDYGLDPADPNARNILRNKIDDIYSNATEVRQGNWRGLGEKLPNGANASGQAKFYIQGNDVVVTDLNGNFVTIMKDGINNPRVMDATKILP